MNTMKFKFINYSIVFFLFLGSCQKKEVNKVSPIIDKQQISEHFDKDISKLLLDHLYVVVDSVTYARLTKDNQWQNNYADLDLGLPDFAPINDHSSTCYIRGHQHYIEILSPKNKYNEPIGKSGIGFSLQNNTCFFG